jgi:hypothetical protein
MNLFMEMNEAVRLLAKVLALSKTAPMLHNLVEMAVVEASSVLMNNGADEQTLQELGVPGDVAYLIAATLPLDHTSGDRCALPEIAAVVASVSSRSSLLHRPL